MNRGTFAERTTYNYWVDLVGMVNAFFVLYNSFCDCYNTLDNAFFLYSSLESTDTFI